MMDPKTFGEAALAVGNALKENPGVESLVGDTIGSKFYYDSLLPVISALADDVPINLVTRIICSINEDEDDTTWPMSADLIVS
jgi:hypothetical protein